LIYSALARYYSLYMRTIKTWQTNCETLTQTLLLASRLGHNLRGGEVIELVSDLGGGKTTFVRGLAEGMGSKDRVSSPSFTLTNQYRSDSLTLQHFDFYRLAEPGIMREELAEVVADPGMVTVVEWASIVEDVLPNDRLTITIQTTSETGRNLSFDYPDKFTYLMEGLN
jgi:tRNA threonylcarbamoyladenosine biosynthesis protein TsaE